MEETITFILAAVVLVFGILQIILFFKLWGMTNDVKRLTVRFDSPDMNYIIKEIHKKNPNIADLLFDSLYNAMQKHFSSGSGNAYSACTYSSIKDKYKELYKKAGVEFPFVFDAINCDNDWINAFTLQQNTNESRYDAGNRAQYISEEHVEEESSGINNSLLIVAGIGFIFLIIFVFILVYSY